jgi:hypothetical protein
MSKSPVPEDVAEFILDRIDSIAELEALLLLRNDSHEDWTVHRLAKRLYIGEPQTAEALANLAARGLLLASGNDPVCYRYQPSTAALDEMVGRLAALYAKHLVPVTNLVHSKPKTRLQEFADAFKFRKND